MAPRDSFLLRIDPKVLNAVRQWASDDLRSVNGQIEFILRRALADSGRTAGKKSADGRDDSKKVNKRSKKKDASKK